MPIKNTHERYGWVHIALHWVMAVLIIGLFALGLWMSDLSYYSEWYRKAPFIHKSVGVLTALLLLMRLIWKITNRSPKPEPTLKRWEIGLAHAVHALLYVLLLIIFVAGYLIASADGNGVDVFGWFTVPSLVALDAQWVDIWGEVHEIAAFVLMGMVFFHAMAAFKHHFMDKDNTLRKMLGFRRVQ